MTDRAFYTWEECQRIESAAQYMRDKLLIRIMYRSACRISEILALTPSSLSTAGLTIDHLKERVKLKCEDCGHRLARDSAFCPGCSSKVTNAQRDVQEEHTKRIVPLDAETVLLLKGFISRQKMERSQRIFALTRTRAAEILLECTERAGLDTQVLLGTSKTHNISPHRLRDAFATHAIARASELGLDPNETLRTLQEIMGHASPSTTQKYVKVGRKEIGDFYKKVME
jgi:integrase/recombinase XerD